MNEGSTIDLDAISHDVKIERGEWAAEANGNGRFQRFRMTKSGVSPRARPGTKGLMFVAGTDEHDERGVLFSDEHTNAAIRRKMQEKRMRKIDEVLKRLPAPKLEGLITQLKLLDKELARFDRGLDESRDAYFQVKEQYLKAQEAYTENYKKKHGVWPETVPMSGSLIADFNQKSLRFQQLLAARQSELQFHDWLLGRVGELVSALTETW